MTKQVDSPTCPLVHTVTQLWPAATVLPSMHHFRNAPQDPLVTRLKCAPQVCIALPKHAVVGPPPTIVTACPSQPRQNAP